MHVQSDEPFIYKERLFSEMPSSVILTAAPGQVGAIQSAIAQFAGVWLAPMATTIESRFEVTFNGKPVIQSTIEDLKSIWANALESQLNAEVHA
jgi:phosphoribosylformylglycinamidine synthase